MVRKKRKRRRDRTDDVCGFCDGPHTSWDCPTLDDEEEEDEEEPRPAPRKRGRGRKWRSFAEARTFARSRGLTSKRAWYDWCASGARPDDIPADPCRTYKDQGWAGYGDWLGCLPDDDEECPYCLDPLPNRIPGCGHRFHRRCVNQMRRSGHTLCPMCRGPLG